MYLTKAFSPKPLVVVLLQIWWLHIKESTICSAAGTRACLLRSRDSTLRHQVDDPAEFALIVAYFLDILLLDAERIGDAESILSESDERNGNFFGNQILNRLSRIACAVVRTKILAISEDNHARTCVGSVVLQLLHVIEQTLPSVDDGIIQLGAPVGRIIGIEIIRSDIAPSFNGRCKDRFAYQHLVGLLGVADCLLVMLQAFLHDPLVAVHRATAVDCEIDEHYARRNDVIDVHVGGVGFIQAINNDVVQIYRS